MANYEIKLNSAGVRELLRSAEMAAICEAQAKAIAQRCGPGYEVSTHVGRNRVNASVYTSGDHAAQDNLDHNTILRSLK